MYYLQYLGSNLSPLNSQNVKNFHCSQCSPQPAGWGQLDPSVRVTQTNGMHQCTLIVLCNGHISM